MTFTVLPDEPGAAAVFHDAPGGRFHCLVGEIETTYARLVEVFGEPNEAVRDDEKTDAAWAIQFPDGLIADIYNYKDGPAYLGRRGKRPQHITEWHVGGKDPAVFARVVDIVKPDAAASLSDF